jgi:NAD(P)-dependent dehydrogenase (short-subunit alcohol dehydrogenase family)
MGVLSGKVAVVTGGGSGIGLATAKRLAEAGVTVAVVDLDGASAQRVATELGGLGLQADVGRSEAWPGIVEAVTARYGGIDLAHLNAGVTTGEADITKVTDAIYRRAVGVNVDGVVFGVRALVPAMAARGGGAIVATASLAGLIGFSPDPIYCVTKHAVVGLVRSLGPQLAERGITINAVCPSIVDTPLIDDVRDVLQGSGFPLIDVSAVSEAVVERLAGEETGEAMVIQAGREAVAFRFSRPPGPRAGGTVGQMPPAQMAAHDQG